MTKPRKARPRVCDLLVDLEGTAGGDEEDFKLLNENSFSSSPPFYQLLCLVGEAFDDYSDDVCGAVVNVRTKGDKIAVWTSDYENREAVTHIG